MRKLLLLAIVLIAYSSIKAQLGDSLKAQLVKDWERAKAYTWMQCPKTNMISGRRIV